MLRLGPTELIIILVIIIAIFGAGKLADVGGAVGRGIKDFRSQVGGDESEDDDQEPADSPSEDSQ